MKAAVHIEPHLIVKNAPRALEFYKTALGAKEKMRLADPKLDGLIVCAELYFGESMISVSEEHAEWNNFGPKKLGGTPVALTLFVADPDAVADRAVELGAELVYPIKDQFYGYRQGRIRDPFGHEWILSKKLEDLSVEEMQKRMASWWTEQK